MSALQTGAFRSVWIFMTPAAIISALAAMTIPGSNDNVFIPFETWLIIVGVVAIERIVRNLPDFAPLAQAALAVTFLSLLYSTQSVMPVGDAQSAYYDLVQFAESLDGPVYAPWLGQVPGTRAFRPVAHWVPLEDMMRNSRTPVAATAKLKAVLRTAENPPDGHAYILNNSPLETDSVVGYLSSRYVLEKDLGDRFRSLGGLKRRYTPAWPRYLYRFDPDAAEKRKVAQR